MRKTLSKLYYRYLGPDRHFVRLIRNLTGQLPAQPEVYRLALKHSSLVSDSRLSAFECNERLEYLGDAVLGNIVSDYLFHKYPTRNEGFLTEMRSKIVGRNSLNEIGRKIGLDQLLQYDRKASTFNSSMCGNTLEALIGAIYLDLGFAASRRFVIDKIIDVHIDLDLLEEQNLNFKSQLMEFAQKNKIEPVVYEVVEERPAPSGREFLVACKIRDEIMGYGSDTKKKLAEQKASEMALMKLCPVN